MTTLSETELIARKRYVDVLAAGGFNAKTSERLWALYRLGCYHAVVLSNPVIDSSRDALAVLVSAAACGYPELFSNSLQEFLERDDGTYSMEACLRVAPFSKEVALKLSNNFNASPELVTALAGEGSGSYPGLRVTEEHIKKEPDSFLLLANQGENTEVLCLANMFLRRHGLSEVDLIDPKKTFTVTNLVCKAGEAHTGPMVTVLMTTYNSSATVWHAATSILMQSYGNLELLIVDDNSTDGTQRVIQELTALDNRVRSVFLSKNGGTYVAKNQGLGLARGELITCNDSDDFSHRNRLWEQVKPLLRNSRLICTASHMVRVTSEGRFVARQIYPLTRLNTSSLMFRRSPVLDRVGRYHPVRAGADSEFHARLRLVFGRSSYVGVPKPLAFVAQRQTSLSSDIESGAPMPQNRLLYWERWNRRHVLWRRLKILRHLGRYAFLMRE